jgi:hypothetical protein
MVAVVVDDDDDDSITSVGDDERSDKVRNDGDWNLSSVVYQPGGIFVEGMMLFPFLSLLLAPAIPVVVIGMTEV